MPICATPGCDNAVKYCSECDSEARGSRPPGFMTLGTIHNETVLIRVAEVASVCEGQLISSGERRGALLTLRSGQQADVRESLGEVTEAMNAEATD